MAKMAIQGGVKNYLGNQKTVSNVPLKWQSGADKPATELAYITKAEKDLLLKKDLHGSLKNGPNTGPEGIMSLDSQVEKKATPVVEEEIEVVGIKKKVTLDIKKL